MFGIDLNHPINYFNASLRFFKKEEHHIIRLCSCDVLVLVFDGVLRFSEDNVPMEVHAGEYYIQRKNSYHAGDVVSDSPKYLYVHFEAAWGSNENTLPRRGHFQYDELCDLIKKLDTASHENHTFCEQQYLFLQLLLSLKKSVQTPTLAKSIAEFIDKNISSVSSISDVCEKFHYSKNYIERLFKKEFDMSPVQYINNAKIKLAMYLLETTSMPIGQISEECGYFDYPYFYKCFIKKVGISPSNWRKKIQNDPLSRI